MTSNQLVILFDAYRGFDQTNHLGNLDCDLLLLGNMELIDGRIVHNSQAAERFPFHGFECIGVHLTNKGREYCESLMKINP